MPRHIYFAAPELLVPKGGKNLMYWFAEILREHGYSVSIHYRTSDYVYPFYQSDVPCTYSPQPERMPAIQRWPKFLRTKWQASRPRFRRKGANRLSVPGRDDLVVLPEFAAAKMIGHYPGVPVVVLAQDVFGAIRGALVPFRNEVPGNADMLGYLTTSDAVDVAVATFSDARHWLVPQMFEPGAFGFVEKKKKQVVFMNRKRPEEISVLRAFLRDSLAEHGFELAEVHNLPKSEALAMLAESLVFVSLSCREGFGMPPAEAMAMGCIAVGYTGVGGNEFFTSDVGFPIPEDDVVALYAKVIDVVREYNADPARLDAMRRKASERMLATYVRENTAHALLKAIEDIAK